MKQKPDFENLLAVFAREKPKRVPLFEFMIDNPPRFFNKDNEFKLKNDSYDEPRRYMQMYHKLGYDFVSVPSREGNLLSFPTQEYEEQESRSLNSKSTIFDEKSFEEYEWPDADNGNYGMFDDMEKELPDGMKFIVYSNDGVLENTTNLLGFDTLCMMIFENPVLLKKIVDSVGSRLLRYYEITASINSVGAFVCNDDWGFSNQTMFSPDTLREYIFPWHKKIVETVHKKNKPIVLHSCGNLDAVMDDVIDNLGYDAKHSYEDKIIPVEKAYEKWGDRIAIFGGMDVNFLSTSTPDEISKRAKVLLELTKEKGGYALGAGNSIPTYIPLENYYAMINARK